MGTISDKLTYLDETREEIRSGINSIGGELFSSNTFRSYAKELEDLYNSFPKETGQTSSSGYLSLFTGKGRIESNIEGYLYQEGTPTPSTPQPISMVTGRQEVKVEGKNLCPVKTFESLSSVRLVSTATSGGATVYGIPVVSGQTYTASFDVTTLPSSDYRIQIINSSDSTQIQSGTDPTNIIERQQITCNQLQRYSVSITTTQAGYLYLRCVPAGFTLDNIQIAKGTNTTYEEYKKQSYEINLGKNLFDYTTSSFSDPYRVNIATENNTITITTTTETTSGNLFFYTKIPDNTLENGATYTISSENVSGVVQSLKLQLRNKNGSTAGKSQVDSVVYDDTYSLYVVGNIFASSGSTSIPKGTTAVIKNVQVEKGNATSYSPYKTPIELAEEDFIKRGTGKNLLNINGLSGTSNNVDYSVSDGVLVLNGTLNSDRIEISLSNPLTINGTYTFSKNYESTIALKDSNYTSVLQVDVALTSQTATVNNTITKIVIYQTNGTTFNNTAILLQVEENNQATSFEPYNYGGIWYTEKNMNKVVLNGSELWQDRPNFNDCDRFVYETFIIPIQTQNGFSNYFNVVKNSSSNIGYIWLNNGIQIVVNFSEKGTTTLAQFKTWLETHNTIVWYKLATPTYTEITDTELLNQLEAFYYAKSYDGQTNFTVTSADLPAILNVSALKKYE